MKKAFALAFVLASCGGGNPSTTPPGGDDDDIVDAAPPADGTAAVCGNGIIETGEICDDGNAAASDGCVADCTQVEPGFVCADPGALCVHSHVCGNGILETDEQCDDHNAVGTDGCSATCELEAGWACAVPGIRCTAASCGDGILAGFEECDDGTPGGGDGCSVGCQLEAGHACAVPGQPCTTTTCGDGVTEGTEECDDQNNDLGDGCDPLCHREPACVAGVCAAVCGDGVLQTGEGCDDGNLHSSDGCSSACAVETGFACTPSSSTEPTTLAVSIVYRDFRGNDLTGGHPDFENHNGTDHGIVTANLGADHKPVYAGNPTTPTTAGAAAFNQWYRDTPTVNMTYAETLTLTRTAAATYVFDNANFFPLDGRGFVGAGTEPARTNGHNFGFTSELRYWFSYAGGEVLSFRGDDDVWVFINGKLAIDLGGVHGAQNASITLDATAATNLSLTVGGTYEVVVLQAERHTTASSYKLTLKGFNAAVSVCDDTCGDGVTSSEEVCDDGVNQGGYGSCVAGCLGFGPRCGDTITQSPQEQCDDGINAGGYDNCSPTCQLGARCGDGIVQAAHEECDDGNTIDTDACSNTCHQPIF
ncbi:MAG: DUF4215 domain-containing protein [Kofleriaceae bacterium]